MTDNEGNKKKGGSKHPQDWFLSKKDKNKTVCITDEEIDKMAEELEEFVAKLSQTSENTKN